MTDQDIFEIVEISSWEELKNALTNLDPGYIFRGQTQANWNIKTTIERTSAKDQAKAEKKMIWEFKKHIYNYDLKRVPESNQEILLFLQHYGAPTRLIDFTKSPYISAFFALNTSFSDNSSIYAISQNDLYNRIATFGDKKFSDYFEEREIKRIMIMSALNKPDTFDEVVIRKHASKIKFVTPIQPIYHHERSNPQSSVHITIGNIRNSFLENLSYLLNNSSNEMDSEKPFLKFVFPNNIREEALYDLNLMNINYSSLFPGFSGFVQNLYLDYECKEYQEKLLFSNFETT